MAGCFLSNQDLDFVSSFDFSNPFHVGTDNGSFDTFCSSENAQYPTKSDEVLEPTPMAQNGVVVVDKLPISAASWNRDDSFLNSLKDLLMESSTQSLEESRNFQANMNFDINKSEHLCLKPHTYENMILRLKSAKSLGLVSLDSSSDGEDSLAFSSFRSSHLEQWNQRYCELVQYQKDHGHCLVPLNWPSNPSLAHWVKRQRYQFRMKREGRHSTLTDERQNALESLGFVWDSHAAGWEERWDELRQFKERYGHCNVPKKYPENQQLAVWVKCQRRQFKLYSGGQNSNMTRDRIEKLRILGFVFDPRSRKRASNSLRL